MRFPILICAFGLVTIPANILAHGGGLAADGCHYDRKNGG